MRGTWGLLVCGVLGMSALARGAPDTPPSSDPPYWVARPGARITARGPPEGGSAHARLTAVAGGRESFVLVLRRPRAASSFEVRTTPLASEKGSIRVDQVYRLAFVDFAGEQRADMLIPLDLGAPLPLEPPEGDNIALWVDVSVPSGTRAGTYVGSVDARLGKESFHVPVVLSVLGGQLSSRASLSTAFDFSLQDAAAANGVEDTEDVHQLGHAYAIAALGNRVTLIGAQAPPRYRVSPGDGAMLLDFADFDREAAPLLDGVAELGGARVTTLAPPIPAGLSSIERFKYLLAFQQHLRQRGWDDRVINLGAPAEGNLLGSLPRLEVQTGSWADCLASISTHRPWWSLSGDASVPKALELGGPGLLPRGIGWLAYASRASGLRYDGALGGFSRASWQRRTDPSALFYPGHLRDALTGKYRVLESVRLKLLRDGLEDYELLVQARAAGHGAAAAEWVRRLAPAPNHLAGSPDDYDLAKHALAELAVPSPAGVR